MLNAEARASEGSESGEIVSDENERAFVEVEGRKVPFDPTQLRKIQEHPCFSREACHLFGRIHLPVAPKCNIQCNYCIRKFDCVNESRPGVTSKVLTPAEAGIRDLRGIRGSSARIERG